MRKNDKYGWVFYRANWAESLEDMKHEDQVTVLDDVSIYQRKGNVGWGLTITPAIWPREETE